MSETPSTTNERPHRRDTNVFQQSRQNVRTLEGRLATFANWSNDAFDPRELAEAGFYSINYSDIVKCAFCSVEGYLWVSESPMENHIMWDEEHGLNCSFVRETRNQNSQSSAGNDDTSSKYGIQVLTNSVSKEIAKKLFRNCIAKTCNAVYPEYVLLERRVESFGKWPKALKQKPTELAVSGFFYTGAGDETQCFQCGGGLKDWEENNDPWEQHAKHFPNCTYVINSKGLGFIENLRNNQESQPSTSRNTNLEAEEEEESSVPESDTKSENDNVCKICYKNDIGIVFLPCGHVVACAHCTAALTCCPICRKAIEATARAFLV